MVGDMERRRLGRTGISVPVIGMGTWEVFDTDEDRSPLVEAALEAGVDLFDTSPMYGRAEDVLGRALAGRRERAIVATKVWARGATEGRRQAAHAVALFGHVDVYQVHNLVDVPTQLGLLEELKEQGKARAVGATHYVEARFDELGRLMATGRLDMVQVPYNPLRREAAERILPLAEALGLGVLVMSPLREGILDARPTRAELESLGASTWAQAVLKWIASDPRVGTVLTATHRLERVAENAGAGRPPFLDEEQRRLVVRIAERG